MPQSDPSKTEKPTPKRIKDARKKGNVAKSQELSKTMGIMIGCFFLYFWISYLSKEMMDIWRYFFSTAITTFDPIPTEVRALSVNIAISLAKMVLPVMLVIGTCAYIVLRIQVGKLWTWQPMKPKLSKLNPLPGLKRMLISPATLGRMGKNILLAAVIGAAPVIVVIDEIPNFMSLYYTDAAGLAIYILKMGFKMTLYALVPMVIISIVDVIYGRWNYIEKLKMSKQEVKDEAKQMEGDQVVKGKMKQKMMQMSMRQMMKAVPKADVVITNPTHIAVAIQYDAMTAPAPIIVAKGADKAAEKIKEIAREHKVPIQENVPLARALFAGADIGDMIPEDLYKAVATILAQIWQKKGINKGGPK
ncbi:flagellar biosynthesis protein FlhB [Desulfovibrio sp. OttesenSCG-928-F07]|nr:flagellar biosynthesis protein FlhB [Desulfovibrio sp. OttesenSCG-928-F07]